MPASSATIHRLTSTPITDRIVMANKNFNPEEWLPKVEPTSTRTFNSMPLDSNTDDIEVITQRIESGRVDITAGYDAWRDIGFALADELGESGRDYFHRISRFNPDYNEAECDKQFDKCMRAHGTGVSIRTFFQKAKDNGISLSTENTRKSAKSAMLAISANKESADFAGGKSAETINADIADSAEIADIPEAESLPTFSQDVKDLLPDFLRKISDVGNSEADTDILILGALTVISACMPHIYGVYDKRIVYPNLFLFVTAKASSGKGRLTLCRYLVEPIHENLREINEAEMMDYKQKLAEYNAAGKKKVNMEKPEEPPMRMLFIPANSSATAVYQVLNDNGGEGLMFETEGDTLANTFGSDYGNFSDGFRKAFHHETISYIRRKDREYVNIKHPKLSTLLTGTPRQILNLISDAENGLFSRFAFYYLDTKMVWNNVFDNSSDQTLDEYFQDLGNEYQQFHKILKDNADLKFRFTVEQEEDFNTTFNRYQSEFVSTYGDEFVASVRRLGVVTFRIAMILSALRMQEDGDFVNDLVCLDQDYQIAKRILDVIIRHNARVFSELPKTSSSVALPARGSQGGKLHQAFFDNLPKEFDRKDYQRIATLVGLNPSSVDRNIRKWVEEGKLENVSHGKYRKP